MENNNNTIENISKKSASFSESLEKLTSLHNTIKEEKNNLSKKEGLLEKDLLSLAKSILELQQDTLSALKKLQQKIHIADDTKKGAPALNEKPKETIKEAGAIFEVKVPTFDKGEEVKSKTVETIKNDDKKDGTGIDKIKEIAFEVKLQANKAEELKPKAEEKKQESTKKKEAPVFEIKLQADKAEELKPKTEENTQKSAKAKEEPVFEVKLRAK